MPPLQYIWCEEPQEVGISAKEHTPTPGETEISYFLPMAATSSPANTWARVYLCLSTDCHDTNMGPSKKCAPKHGSASIHHIENNPGCVMYITPFLAFIAQPKQFELLLEEEFSTLKSLVRLSCDPCFSSFCMISLEMKNVGSSC